MCIRDSPFPIDNGAELTVDPGTADVHTLLNAVHEMGAEVVPMNHPYNDYGYFTNIAKNAVPGVKRIASTLWSLMRA